jgi:hypothetical protein
MTPIRALDDDNVLRGENPWRVLFLVQRPESWLNVHGVWRIMREDARFQPVVWIVAHSQDENERHRLRHQCREALAQHGVDLAQADLEVDPELRPGDFSAVIFNAPYDRERPNAFHADKVADTVPLSIYIPYGLVMGGGWKNQRYQYAQPTQMRAGLIAARSEFERDLYARFCPTGAAHVRLTGLPRLDELIDLGHFPVDPLLTEAIGGRFAILWNSHFSFGLAHARHANYSTFDSMARSVFEFARRRPDLAVVWRPHPGLFRALVEEGVVPLNHIDALRQAVLSSGVILDERPDHRHAFAASDMLMTDLGSFLVEYLVTEKPLVYLENPLGEGLNDEGRALVQYVDVVREPEHALHLAAAFAEGRDSRTLLRRMAKDRFLPMLDGRASNRIVEAIALALSKEGNTARARVFPPLLESMFDRLDDIAAAKRKMVRERDMVSGLLEATRNTMVEWIKRHPRLLRGIERARSTRR